VKWNEKTLFFYFEDDHARIMSGSKDVERRMSSDNPESIMLSPTKKTVSEVILFIVIWVIWHHPWSDGRNAKKTLSIKYF